MSKVGLRIISIPSGVTAKLEGQILTVKGPLGELTKNFLQQVKIHVTDSQITVTRINEEKFSKQIHGTTNSLIQGMVIGVSEGFSKTLEILGVGYGVTMNGNQIELSLGLSHKIKMEIPTKLKVEVISKTEIKISGIDKQLVGEFAQEIKRNRPPEPYGGKGIRYKGEFVRRKAGKAAGK